MVGAIVAVNCNGDVPDPDTGEILAGTLTPDRTRVAGAMSILMGTAGIYKEGFKTNTTIGVVATNGILTKSGATRVAMMAHDGYARTINPIHTLGDGDVVFTLGTGLVTGDVNRIGALAAWVMAQAVVKAVRAADTFLGVPSCREIGRTQEPTGPLQRGIE